VLQVDGGASARRAATEPRPACRGSLGFRRAGSDFRRLGGSYPYAYKSYRRRFSVALGGGRAGRGYQPDGTGSLVK
jgi:hypothetical protein